MNEIEFKKKYQIVPIEEYANDVLENVPNPTVSIVVSTFQHVDYIRECLNGILMQETTFPVEVLIGEDESTDGTREICMEYADRNPKIIRLFLHRRENNIKIHGSPTGRFQNTYTRLQSRGKYIAFCEGDDYWSDAEKLEKQVAFLEKNPSYVLSHHDAQIINKYGHVVKQSKLPNENKRHFDKKDLVKGPFILTLTLCHRNVITEYPNEYFDVLNGDTFLISLLGQHGGGAYQGEVHPATYREHGGGIWSLKTRERKVRILHHTYGRLSDYYSGQAVTDVTMYFTQKYYRTGKTVIKNALKRKQYGEAAGILYQIIKQLCMRGDYLKATRISIMALHYMLFRGAR